MPAIGTCAPAAVMVTMAAAGLAANSGRKPWHRKIAAFTLTWNSRSNSASVSLTILCGFKIAALLIRTSSWPTSRANQSARTAPAPGQSRHHSPDLP